jgi:catechol 2,3-dioxygenase-like lactoylglutathione lyase family enzyme
MPIQSLHHLYIESPRYEASVAFWKGLGFTVESTWGDEGHRACRLAANGAAVVLAEAEKPHHPTVHLAIDDIEAMDQHVDGSMDVEVTAPLEKTHWGTKWIRVRDPDGNVYALESE